ncbi:conserved hypothetical protein [Ricinus communis]|uniref:Uncharacterized protein n=1 Tax=Ricinus communis TaxID=3988 RepID=B9RJT8_RICCO|nr:conserved hypothetical protein [Ricinus communis]
MPFLNLAQTSDSKYGNYWKQNDGNCMFNLKFLISYGELLGKAVLILLAVDQKCLLMKN